MRLVDLNQLSAALTDSSSGAPVENWSPSFCGDIPLTISFNGQWTYQGSPINKPKLVSLFASVLKLEENQYFLVTPVEKVRITVEDVPFIIQDWETINDVIWLKTQTGQAFPIDPSHPISLKTLKYLTENDPEIPEIGLKKIPRHPGF